MTAPKLAPLDQLTVPAIYWCRVTHHRTDRVRYGFRHTMILWLVDVDRLPHRLLSRRARFSPSDHLGDRHRGVGDNVRRFLAEHEPGPIDRILMLAQPRTFTGYAFDPVTFFYCYRPDGELARIIAEVRNTFGERHCYLVDPGPDCAATVAKQLYVSPYFPVDGHYRMRFMLGPERLRVTITLHRPRRTGASDFAPETPAIAAVLTGRRVNRAAAALAGAVLSARRTIVLIHWQALRLRRAGLNPARRQYHRPQPMVDVIAEDAPKGGRS